MTTDQKDVLFQTDWNDNSSFIWHWNLFEEEGVLPKYCVEK